MKLIKTIQTDHSKNAGNWEVFFHDDTVYVRMAAGFGVKKRFINLSFIKSDEEKAIQIAQEITKHDERKANEIWKSNGWVFWDYCSDFEYHKSNAQKAPQV